MSRNDDPRIKRVSELLVEIEQKINLVRGQNYRWSNIRQGRYSEVWRENLFWLTTAKASLDWAVGLATELADFTAKFRCPWCQKTCEYIRTDSPSPERDKAYDYGQVLETIVYKCPTCGSIRESSNGECSQIEG